MLRTKYPKGTHGSLNYRKKIKLIMIVIGLLGVFSILWLGIRMTGSKKNLLTVVSVLCVLPVGNIAATYLAMLPYKTGPEGAYQSIKEASGKLVMAYDLVITSKTLIIPIEAVAVHEDGIFLFAPNEKVKGEETEEYICSMISGNMLEAKIKVIKNLHTFIEQLEKLNEKGTMGRDSDDLLKKEGVLVAISM